MPVIDYPDTLRKSKSYATLRDEWPLGRRLDEATSSEFRNVYSAIGAELHKSIQASNFLSSEEHFEALRFRLFSLRRLSLNTEARSWARASAVLEELRLVSLAPSQLVGLSDEPGVAITFFNGGRRAELELLDDDSCFLTMYDKTGPINVTEPELDSDFEQTIMLIRKFLVS